MPPVQVKGEVLSVKQVGDYLAMTVVASGIAEQTRPGQFVAVAVTGDQGAMLLRRAFSIHQVADRGVYGGTVEFVFAVHGKGTAWLASRARATLTSRAGHLNKPVLLPRRSGISSSQGWHGDQPPQATGFDKDRAASRKRIEDDITLSGVVAEKRLDQLRRELTTPRKEV